MNNCNCPAPTALTALVAENCGVDLTQIQRLAFQRNQTTAPFSATDVLTLSAWQALIAATDDTKIIVTPLIAANPIIEAGDAITTGGGDNSTLNGVENFEGVNPSKFSCEFKSLSPAGEKAFKKLLCETNLTVYMFLQGGKIAVKKVSTSVSGLTIQSVFLSDRNNAGYGAKDTFKHSFSIPAGWSEDIEIYVPSFNPLTEL